MDIKIGVIGGSGLYEIDGLKDATWQRVETPWGEASDEAQHDQLPRQCGCDEATGGYGSCVNLGLWVISRTDGAG